MDTIWVVNIGSNLQPINPHPNDITTTEASVLHKSSFMYDSEWNTTERDETDWYAVGGSGTAISKTLSSFTTIGALPFQRPEIVSLWGINPQNGQLELQRHTGFFYDETALTPTPSNVPNKSAVSGGRGNLTTVHRYKDANNLLIQRFAYDDLGNVIQTTDPMSHSTTISYADRFRDAINRNTFAFPTQVTNAQSHVTQTTYDYNTSLVTSSSDPRLLQTSRTYDLLNRPVTITEPSGRVTTYTYTDSVPKVLESVQVDDAGNTRKTEVTLDKFGRPITIRNLDPNGDVFRNIVYDGKGRQKQVSEPYRTGSPVWTTTIFNALDRPVQITHPDSSYLQYVYIGNVVTAADEAGNAHEYTLNALGQLVQVKEPNPTLSTPLTTTYSHYVLVPSTASISRARRGRWFTTGWAA